MYSLPPSPQHINPAASALIKRMLHADPAQRPTIDELQADKFFTTGYVPLRLPTTCLTVPPRFSMGPTTATELNQRRPLTAINNMGRGLDHSAPKDHRVDKLFILLTGQSRFLFPDGMEKVDVKEEPMQR